MNGQIFRAVLASLVVLAVGTAEAGAQAPRKSGRTVPAAKEKKEAPVADENARETGQDPEKPATKDQEPGAGDAEKPAGPKLEKATLAGGCFWCIEAVFEKVPGVRSAVSGYTGGVVPNPTYEQVCTGQTGHAEAVQLVYDANIVSFDKVLKTFFSSHDPTTLNSQGPDHGTQYRSAIFAHDEAQYQAAKRFIAGLAANRVYRQPVVTEVVPLDVFFPAEPYHQDYYKKHPNAAYCRIYIEPKLRKLKVK